MTPQKENEIRKKLEELRLIKEAQHKELDHLENLFYSELDAVEKEFHDKQEKLEDDFSKVALVYDKETEKVSKKRNDLANKMYEKQEKSKQRIALEKDIKATEKEEAKLRNKLLTESTTLPGVNKNEKKSKKSDKK
jgi:hypothetical protein